MLCKVVVKSVKEVQFEQVVCDISVKDNNNFFACDKISKFPILVHNCGLDTVIPFAIRELQLLRAKDKKYVKFEAMVIEQMSDVIHSLATLEYNGYPIDIDYLYTLKLPNSPIEEEIKKLETTLLTSDAVQKTNAIILKDQGVPKTTLFGGDKTLAFALNKKGHLRSLFFDVLGLKPLKKGKSGYGKIDKAFQEQYSDVPEVKMFTAYGKALKLRDAYVNQMLQFWGSDEDFRSDRRVRCRFNYLPVITGRVSASKPGLQQIPTRSALGKHIKRLFVSGKGKIIVKVDYRVHEIRGWGIISQDKIVAKSFQLAQDIMKEYRVNPSPELLNKLKNDGDVHRVNCTTFFNKKLKDVTEDDRDAIKGVVFGLIYGMTLPSLAKRIKREIEATKTIVDTFFKRFVSGASWFETTHKFANKHFFVESPIGRRRNLYYIFSKNHPNYDRVKSYLDRRSVNSLVQGMASDFMMIGIRSFCKRIWDYSVEHGYDPYIKPCVSVHDSLEVETDYEHLLLTIALIEQSLTEDVKRIVKERNNYTLLSELAIDFEIGVTSDALHKWFGDLEELESIAYTSLLDQNTKLKCNYSDKEIDKIMNTTFSHDDFMCDWMVKQVKNCKPKFKKYVFDADTVPVIKPKAK